MTTAAKQPLYEVGVESLYIAMYANGGKDEGVLPTFEAPTAHDVIETIGIQGNQTSVTKWASNKIFAQVVKNTLYTLTLDHPALPIEVMDAIHGYIAEKGIVFNDAKPTEYPCFAVGIIAPLSDGINKLARWWPKVQVTPPQETFTTITEETTVPTKQLVMTAQPLNFNSVTQVDFNSARESALGITAEQFMAQVICDYSQLATLGAAQGASLDKGDE